MSISSCETPSIPLTAPITSMGGNNDGFGNGGGGAWWIVLFLIFAFRNGGGLFGNGGNCGGGANSPGIQGLVTRSDLCGEFNFNNLDNAIRGLQASVSDGFHGIDNAVCQLGYQSAQLSNGIQMQVANGFGKLDTSLCQLGNNIAQGINGTNVAIMQGQNALQNQISDCCCTTQRAIDGVNYNASLNSSATLAAINNNTTQNLMNTNAIQQQIQQTSCDNEKIAMQSRFDAQQNTCNTLQAIDRVGDRIIDYLAAEKAQTLRDENQALRLAASQSAQNQYLINQLRPCPQPAYLTCNPFTGQSFTGYSGNSCAC